MENKMMALPVIIYLFVCAGLGGIAGAATGKPLKVEKK
jgi:hypothetical protein